MFEVRWREAIAELMQHGRPQPSGNRKVIIFYVMILNVNYTNINLIDMKIYYATSPMSTSSIFVMIILLSVATRLKKLKTYPPALYRLTWSPSRYRQLWWQGKSCPRGQHPSRRFIEGHIGCLNNCAYCTSGHRRCNVVTPLSYV